ETPCHLEAQPRLADAAGTGQGYEPVRDNQIHHEGERRIPPYQLGQVSGKVRRVRRGGGTGRDGSSDLAGELVASAGHRPDEIALGAEYLAQCGDLRLEVVLVDDPVGPYPAQQLVLAEDSATGVEEGHEGVEGAPAEVDRQAIGEQPSAMAEPLRAANVKGMC